MTEKRSEVVSLRFSPEEVAELREQADAHDRKLSVHLHDLAMLGLLHTRPGVQTRQLPSGGVLATWPADPNITITATNGAL